MTEPASAAGSIITMGTITVAGSFAGMQYDALLLGLFGGVVALRYAGAMSALNLAISLLLSMLAAGLFSPIAKVAAVQYFPWVHAAGDAVRTGAALVIGICALTVVGLFLGWLQRKGGQL